ncbi:hypothetical protein FHT00_001045 [Sphingomonas insulae]|nr:hypothetical protein [Sphingomonas insulae]
MATVAKIDFQEIAFTTADPGDALHPTMLRSGRRWLQCPLTATTALKLPVRSPPKFSHSDTVVS